MKTACEVVENSAICHGAEGFFDHGDGVVVSGFVPIVQHECEVYRLGEFRSVPETAIEGVKTVFELKVGFVEDLG